MAADDHRDSPKVQRTPTTSTPTTVVPYDDVDDDGGLYFEPLPTSIAHLADDCLAMIISWLTIPELARTVAFINKKFRWVAYNKGRTHATSLNIDDDYPELKYKFYPALINCYGLNYHPEMDRYLQHLQEYIAAILRYQPKLTVLDLRSMYSVSIRQLKSLLENYSGLQALVLGFVHPLLNEPAILTQRSIGQLIAQLPHLRYLSAFGIFPHPEFYNATQEERLRVWRYLGNFYAGAQMTAEDAEVSPEFEYEHRFSQELAYGLTLLTELTQLTIIAQPSTVNILSNFSKLVSLHLVAVAGKVWDRDDLQSSLQDITFPILKRANIINIGHHEEWF